METVDETIFRLQQVKERSAQRTSEYAEKLLLQILEQLEVLSARTARIEEEILAARIESANKQ